MTQEQIATEYLAREKAANAKPAGADVHGIIRDMCSDYGLERRDVVRAVLDTIARPN